MNLFRRLTADTPGELLAAQVATTSQVAEDATNPAGWVPAPEYPDIWAAFATLADNPGVLTADTPGLPAPATTEGDPQ